jgi:hypothetical protein
MASVFKLEKQGDILQVGYRPGQSGPAEPDQPKFFLSLESAEKHLAEKLSCEIAKVLNGPVGRIYKSHLGTFALTEHEAE